MRALRRLAKDESGMTMGITVIMILLLGVMGAGLLTFVSRDLNTVVEVNQGQRAFELADAGVAAAKRQLASNVVREHYDGAGTDDIQWSFVNGGLRLDDLDGNPTTPDSVNVTINYKAATADFPEHFEVISEGTYADAKRRIEATFEGVEVGGGGQNLGHPLYFTPSSISIDGPNVALNAISMFSEADILIEGVTDRASFVSDYTSNGGTLTKLDTGTKDELCNWDSDTPLNNCFEDATGNWNTVGRTKAGSTNAYEQPGFAAEGEICGYTTATAPGACTSASAADGVYGYDSTTGTTLGGNGLTFVDKEELLGPGGSDEPNLPGTISYPFPRPTPIPEELAKKAYEQGRYHVHNPLTSPVNFDTLFNSPAPGGQEKVVFVDAQNNTLNFSTSNQAKNSGTLVIWCGRLQQNQNYSGIILSLYGESFTFESGSSTFTTSSCPDNTISGYENIGTYRNTGVQCQCWTYAEGGLPSGTGARAGIEIGPGSQLFFLPSGNWSFLNDAFEGPPPTSFELKGWRELYE